MNLFSQLKIKKQTTILKVLAELSSRFNSQYRAELKFDDIYSNSVHELGLSSQFMPVYYRFDQMKVAVAGWQISLATLEKIDGLIVKRFCAEHIKADVPIQLYLPVDYFAHFPNLVRQLPPPSKYFEGYLTPSGRTLWLFNKENNGTEIPVCIKINTHFLKTHEQFTVKPLPPWQAIHSVCVSNYLRRYNQVLSENFALQIRQVNPQGEDENVHLYIERQLDFEKNRVDLDDTLIPLHALCGPSFWFDSMIRELYHLDDRAREYFFEEDWPRELARIIRQSLDELFIHFELHQQNLTAHFAGSRLKELLYHDLLDTAFDPITYFIDSADLYDLKLETIKKLSRNSLFNAFGEIDNSDRKIKDITVGSIYRRYLRNFGDFTRVYNMFMNQDFLIDRNFEKKVLRELKFSAVDLCLEDLENQIAVDLDFVKNDLFWSIERYLFCKQRRGLREIKNTRLNSLRSRDTTSAEAQKIFNDKYAKVQGFSSIGFPCRRKFYDGHKIESIQMSSDQRVFWGRYAGLDFLVIFND